MSSKNICQNCGVVLTERNRYMDGMCMECKCGIDWDDKLSVSNSNNISVIKHSIDPYKLFGELTMSHRDCEDVLVEIGKLVDSVANQVQKDPDILEEMLEDTSVLKDISLRLRAEEQYIQKYKDIVDKYILMLQTS